MMMLQTPSFMLHGMGFLCDVSCKEGKWFARIKVITHFDTDNTPCCDKVLLNCSVNHTGLQALVRQLSVRINGPISILVDFDMAYNDIEACFSGMTAEDPNYMLHINGELLAINSLSKVNCPEELGVYLPVPSNDSIKFKIKALCTGQK
jgi:hypothetical protein